MRNRLLKVGAAALLVAGSVVALEYTVGQMVYRTKHGAVTYDHVAHTKRAKFNCVKCHTEVFKVFPPLARGPLHYRATQHRTPEAAQSSCGMCHRPGGESFPSAGNCGKCHVKPVVTPYYPQARS